MFKSLLTTAARMNQRPAPVAADAAAVPAHVAAEWTGAGRPESAAERVRRVLEA